MKLEIYKEKEEETVKEEKPLKIRLIRSEWGSIFIAAVDDDGKPLRDGVIASILSNGTLRLFWFVNPKLGFQLNKHGRIIVEK